MNEYRVLIVDNLKGLNLDLSDEKVPPNEAITFTNMKIGDLGIPETVNGCSLKKSFSITYDDAESLGRLQTRGEDYVFIYHADGRVRVWGYPDWVLQATLTPTFTEKTWFAEHNNEMWVGNMAEGVYRWRSGHQEEMRGSAPEDIIVEPYEDGEADKKYNTWRFAYDYEINGGRSALSRWARVQLYHPTHKVKLTVDTSPTGSRNRRIYAAHSSDYGENWSDWYYVYEEDDNGAIEVVLDSELLSNRIDSRKYTEDTGSNITPQAKYGISFEDRIVLACTVDSPTKIVWSEVGRPYFNFDDYYDLKEIITGLAVDVRNNKIIATTPNKIHILGIDPEYHGVLSDSIGAFKDSVGIGIQGVHGVSSKGVWVYDGEKIQIISNISSTDFSGLEAVQRYFLLSSQQDFEQGDYKSGISSDYVPGALSLQPNLREDIGLKGMLDRAPNYGTSKIGTNTSLDPAYYAQKFKVPGSSTTAFTLKYIGLYMKAYGTLAEQRDFQGEIRADDSGEPNMDETLTTFSGKVDGGAFHWREFELDDALALNEDTDYWLVIPAQGEPNADWWIKWYSAVTGIEYYPQGTYYTSEEGGDPGTWSDQSAYFTFYLKGGGTVLITSEDLATYNADDIRNDSHDTAYAQRFFVSSECDTVRGELLVHSKSGSPDNPAITIEGESSGAPDGVTVATASSITEEGDLLRFDFDTQTLAENDGAWYWLVVGKTGGSDYWDWGEGVYATGNYLKIKTNGSWSSNYEESIWCKIFADATDEEADWRTVGDWVGPEFEIQSADTFKKIYARKMKPTGADIIIKAGIYDGSWHYVTLYDSDASTDNLPYNIENNYPDATKVKFTDSADDNYGIRLELGDASYTPIVDSLFVTYTKDGDSGDLLHCGTVNGEWWVSRDDADNDASDTFTLVHDKFGNWQKLSEPFFGFLQMGEKVTLGIGANENTPIFNALEQTSRDYRRMAVTPNGNVYVTVWAGDIYMQTGGTGDFAALGQTSRNWRAITSAPNGNVYAAEYNGDIYMQTGGSGDFVAFSQTSRAWQAMTADSDGNIYATVYGGDIYKQTAGTGDFVAMNQTDRSWIGITTDSSDNIYAADAPQGGGGGDIYKRTGGTGDFEALSQTYRNWRGLGATPNGNVFAVVYNGDIYKQTNGSGDFEAMNQTSRAWRDITATPEGDLYACVYDDDIYKIQIDAKNIYKLDDSSVDVWYSGDTITKDIDTEWESGWILYSHIVKYFRKARFSITGDDGESLSLSITTSGGELNSSNDATGTFTDTIYLHGTTYIKPYLFSLPTTIQGKWVKIEITGDGVDWKFHDYEIEYKEKGRRNLATSDAGT